MNLYNCANLHLNSAKPRPICLLQYNSLAYKYLLVELIQKPVDCTLDIAPENMCTDYCADWDQFQGGDTLLLFLTFRARPLINIFESNGSILQICSSWGATYARAVSCLYYKRCLIYTSSNFATSVCSIAPPMCPIDFPFTVWLSAMCLYNCADLHKNLSIPDGCCHWLTLQENNNSGKEYWQYV